MYVSASGGLCREKAKGCDVSSEEFVEMVDAKISKVEPQISKKSWGGSRPNSGGRRPGSGRRKDTPNKVTAEIKQLAQQYGPGAIAELARLATSAESEAARVAAIKELPDRGYGRAVESIRGSVTYGMSEQLAELFSENASGTFGREGCVAASERQAAALTVKVVLRAAELRRPPNHIRCKNGLHDFLHKQHGHERPADDDRYEHLAHLAASAVLWALG